MLKHYYTDENNDRVMRCVIKLCAITYRQTRQNMINRILCLNIFGVTGSNGLVASTLAGNGEVSGSNPGLDHERSCSRIV